MREAASSAARYRTGQASRLKLEAGNFRPGEQFRMSEQPAVSIRRYAEKDGPAVRELFIQVNRELAPSAMRDQFEIYIAGALREEIDRIEAYYAERKGSFWIAEDSDRPARDVRAGARRRRSG